MKLFVRNMVCSRCISVVKTQIEGFGLHPISVSLGEIDLIEKEISLIEREKLNRELMKNGFELIDNKKSRLIEKIKTSIVELVHYSNTELKTNFSEHISRKLNHDYNYLSSLFSETEGTTIEKYFINQKIEKVKELLMYDELSLSEIADKLNYSSVAHLSNQFKKVTGLTPSFFKQMKKKKRIEIEKL